MYQCLGEGNTQEQFLKNFYINFDLTLQQLIRIDLAGLYIVSSILILPFERSIKITFYMFKDNFILENLVFVETKPLRAENRSY